MKVANLFERSFYGKNCKGRMRSVRILRLRSHFRSRMERSSGFGHVETLEARLLLASDITNLAADLQMLGATLATEAGNVMDQATFDDFELLFKQQYTDLVVEDIVDFIDEFNPVPDSVSEFLTTPVLDIPGLNEILDVLSLSTVPKDLIETFGSPALKSALEGLDFFIDINNLQTSIDAALGSMNIADFDDLFMQIETDFGVTLPLISDFDMAVTAAAGNVAALQMLAQNVADTLQDTGGTLSQEVFDFSFDTSGSISATLFGPFETVVPGFGVELGFISAGAMIGGEVTGTLEYSLIATASVTDGFGISSAQVTAGIGLSGFGSVGVDIVGVDIDLAELRATISGELMVQLDPALDTSMDGIFQADEIFGSSCYFETDGGVRFRAEVSYIDPVGALTTGILDTLQGDPPTRTHTLYNDLIWSAKLSSCDPADAGTGEVTLDDGVLNIVGSEGNDTIKVSLDNSDPDNPKYVVDINGNITEIGFDAGVERIVIDALEGMDNVMVASNVLIPADLIGGPGDDTLMGGGGNDTYFGGEDNDTLITNGGFDLMFAGAGNDDIEVGPLAGGVVAYGEAGEDNILVEYNGNLSRAIIFDGGDDDDLITLFGGAPGLFNGVYDVGLGADEGTITYSDSHNNRQVLRFLGLEPIDDVMLAATLTVNASEGQDDINIIDGPTVPDGMAGTIDTTEVNFNGAFEEIRLANKTTLIVNGGGSDDVFSANLPNPGPGLLNVELNGGNGREDFTIVPGGVTYTLDGGAPTVSETLNVDDSGIAGDASRITLREGLTPDSGSITVGTLPPIYFSNIERLHRDLSTDPDLVVLKADPYEPNDTLSTAHYLGTGETINVDPSIDPGGDEDFFEFLTQYSGTLDFHVFFSHADGDIDIEVQDSDGTVIASALSTTDNERITIAAVRDETYFLRVFGADQTVENAYEFSVINTPAPIPFQVDLQAGSDSGRHDNDDVTNVTTPTFDIYLDDDRLEEFLNLDLVPDTDFDVQVFNNGVLLGEATFQGPAAGVDNNSRWQFTAVAGDLQEGHNNFITAAVLIRDAATPQATGRGEFSVPLQVTLDTIAPPVSIVDIDPAQTDTGVEGHPGTFTDRITSDTATGFWGWAEANAIVRLYVDAVGDGAIGNPALYRLTVAEPRDGDHVFPMGQWSASYVNDLNNPNAPDSFPFDGLREVIVEAEDLAGNVNTVTDQDGDTDQILDIFIDTQGPRITAVEVNEPGNSYNLFDPKPSVDGPTPAVHSLIISVSDLPNRITDFLYDALQAPGMDPAVDPGNYLLVGDNNGTIPIFGVTFTTDPALSDGSPAEGYITLNFDNPGTLFIETLPDDRYTLTIKDSIVDPAGNALDGESNATQPLDGPTFPSGDGQPGGDFVARFTVDTRAELGVWAAGSIYIDTNGNFVLDPVGKDNDTTNEDITYVLGFTSDNIFAGNFATPTGDPSPPADGFDKIAAYGRFGGVYRWLIDTDNDGVADIGLTNPIAIDGLPAAGDFDGDPNNGDGVVLKAGNTWFIDLNGNLVIEAGEELPGNDMVGKPIVGDFDGDGMDDLGAWADNKFSLNLSSMGPIDGFENFSFSFGFAGVRERPFAADFDGDGIDDLGLWVPDRSGATPAETAEWYILVSHGRSIVDRVNQDTSRAQMGGTLNGGGNIASFAPEPLVGGYDIYAQFSDDFALPLVGNFDPPVAGAEGGGRTMLTDTNTENPLDVDANGEVVPLDALLVVNAINDNSAPAGTHAYTDGMYYDVNADGKTSAIDVLWIANHINEAGIASGEGETVRFVSASTTIEQNAAANTIEVQASTSKSITESTATESAEPTPAKQPILMSGSPVASEAARPARDRDATLTPSGSTSSDGVVWRQLSSDRLFSSIAAKAAEQDEVDALHDGLLDEIELADFAAEVDRIWRHA